MQGMSLVVNGPIDRRALKRIGYCRKSSLASAHDVSGWETVLHGIDFVYIIVAGDFAQTLRKRNYSLKITCSREISHDRKLVYE